MRKLHVATDRHVITYEPDGWTAGVITGYVKDTRFVVEHIIACQPHALRRMIRSALEGPWSYRHIVLQIPDAHPRARQLRALARWAGFEEYDPGNWVAYR